MAAVVGFPSMTSRREGHQPHIPRLAYCNSPSTASISENSIITLRTQSSAASISSYATSPPTSPFCPSPRSFQFSDGSLSPFSLDGASDRPTESASRSSPSAKESKKKSSSFFKFLSVKEPSTQAFEAYQEQMKKRGTTQSGRANAVGLSGVSSAKLPPTVPKVNSKWNGVPQSTKERAKDKGTARRPSIGSTASRPTYTSRSTGSNMTTMTTNSTSSTNSAPRSNGKLKFDHSNGNLSDLYGWEIGAPSSGSSTRSMQLESRESPTSAPTLCFNGLSLDSPQSATAPKPSCGLSTNTPPALDPSSGCSSPSTLPALPSPLTPDISVPALSISIHHQDGDNTRSEGPPNPGSEGVVLSSSGMNVLGPPFSATRKTKVALCPAGEASGFNHPAEAPSSILKRPALISNESWPLSSPLTKETSKGDADKVNHSATPARGTKSKMSAMISIFSNGA